jgi:hypothetical protein
VRLVVLGLLLTNLRATFIASEWKPASEEEDMPTRFNESLRDKLVDAWPPKLWPRLQIPFYVLSVLWLIMSLLGLFALIMVRMGIVHLPGVH